MIFAALRPADQLLEARVPFRNAGIPALVGAVWRAVRPPKLGSVLRTGRGHGRSLAAETPDLGA
jgi:hypothetical protein